MHTFKISLKRDPANMVEKGDLLSKIWIGIITKIKGIFRNLCKKNV